MGLSETQTLQLSIHELIPNFKAALASNAIVVIKSMWENNPQLASYFSGKPINIQVTNEQGLSETQTLQLSIHQLIPNFKVALVGRTQDIIRSMWENNLQLALYFSGKPIEVQVTNEQGLSETQTLQLSIHQLISNFKAALASHSIVVIRSMWENNSQLASYFSGKPIAVQVTNEQGLSETQTLQLAIHELISNFKDALAGRIQDIIKSMWENNSQLALYFNGKPIEVQVTNKQGLNETQTWQLSIHELIHNFKAALASNSIVVIKSMWENNSQFASYFSGNPIEVRVTNEQGLSETQTWQISIHELILNFKTALASTSIVVIKSMWENNLFLHDAIKTFDNTKLIELTEKVLSSSKTGKSEFIEIFLNFIANEHILEACLNKRTSKKQTPYVKNQVTSLTNCLTSIRDRSASLSRRDPMPPHNSNAEYGESMFIDNSEVTDGESNSIMFIDNSYNYEITDSEFDAMFDNMVADKKSLLNNSMFDNKRPRSPSPNTTNKSQKLAPMADKSRGEEAAIDCDSLFSPQGF